MCVCRPSTGALLLGSPTRALNELVSEERERVIELLAALTASSDLVEQQRCQILDLKDALQARVNSPVLSYILWPSGSGPSKGELCTLVTWLLAQIWLHSSAARSWTSRTNFKQG